ncbi:MAG: hypothetical protein QHH07_03825 [Sedimentisphaerales bacterium]|jgi:hypothetical protein|nr:hypothetical protein [Sedimentisphaerales bacterium]
MKTRQVREIGAAALLVGLLAVELAVAAPFDQKADYQIDSMGYYYVITGGKFPNGQTVNGIKTSGGSMAFILDAPDWQDWGYNYALDVWHKDGWFAQTAGLALTMKYQGTTVFDNFNNDAGDFYTTPAGQASKDTPVFTAAIRCPTTMTGHTLAISNSMR